MVDARWLLCFSLWLSGCDVPEPPPSSGGVQLPEGPCGRGAVIVQSDYASTNIALATLDGTVASSSLLSSGSRPPGASAALSGDVVVPWERPESGRVVLIDRYPNAVLTWVEPTTAQVVAQLSVATGFASNPHDYVELGDGRAYVSRYESNAAAGAEPWDAGGDLLILGLDPPHVLGRVGLDSPDDGDLLPRADRLMRAGGQVYVLLQRFDASFSKAGAARLAGVDIATDAVVWTVDLAGYSSCGAMARTPSGSEVVVVCSGATADQGEQLHRSGVVVLDASASPPTEIRRFDLGVTLQAPLAPSIGFLDDRHLIGVAYGDLLQPRGDVVFALDLVSGLVETLATSGDAFVFGDVRCASPCGAPCLVADAESMALRRWSMGGMGASELSGVPMQDAIGLPPRGLGGF